MQGIWRRVVYVGLYESIAIGVVSLGLTWMTGSAWSHSGLLALLTSAVAVAWTVLFNAGFERWEARQSVRGRSFRRRAVHAVGFEGGLVAMLVPLMAWWYGIGLVQALWMDLGLVVFFLGYTFVFNWGFDRVFGLPLSAQPA